MLLSKIHVFPIFLGHNCRDELCEWKDFKGTVSKKHIFYFFLRHDCQDEINEQKFLKFITKN